jgi:acyl-CoA synthetase (NDP forming)
VLAVVEACGKKGVRGLIVITAGFKGSDRTARDSKRGLPRS